MTLNFSPSYLFVENANSFHLTCRWALVRTPTILILSLSLYGALLPD